MEEKNDVSRIFDCPHCHGKHNIGFKCQLAPIPAKRYDIMVSCPEHDCPVVRSPMIDDNESIAFWCAAGNHHLYIAKYKAI